MAMALTRFSHWIWPGNRTRRARELPAGSTAVSNGLFPDSPSGFREPNAVRLPSSGGGPRPRKGRNRRPSREDCMIDREHDMVIVPSDGGGTFRTLTLTTPTGPSAGSSRRRRRCRAMVTLRAASPSLCRATVMAVLSSLCNPTAAFLLTVFCQTTVLPVAIPLWSSGFLPFRTDDVFILCGSDVYSIIPSNLLYSAFVIYR